MRFRFLTLLVPLVGAAALLVGQVRVPGEEPGEDTDPPVQEGVEPLARGPVHEAFAQPITAKAEAPDVETKEPPAPVEEIAPDQKPDGNNVQWIPGYWDWDDEQENFLWVSGFWRDVPPGREWVPGHWQEVKDGWQWVHGFWAS